jgi:hypothetical protein
MKRIPHAPVTFASGNAAAGVDEARDRPGAHRAQRRRDAEDETGDDRHECGEQQHAGVERHVEPLDHTTRGRQAQKRAGSPDREDRSERAAGQRQQQALGQQLADDASAARADCQARGDFRLPRGAARDQQTAEVAARDQQHEQDAERIGKTIAHAGQPACTGRHRHLPECLVVA